MALTPFFGSGRNGIFDPFDLGFWDPVDSWPSNFFGRNVGRDVQAVASTRIDWVETPEAHVFKADLPGKYDMILNPYIAVTMQNTFQIPSLRDFLVTVGMC
jgi:hypothetical protein